jgi:monofunctional chorismate mutase
MVGEMRLRAARGAIATGGADADAVLDATERLLVRMLDANRVDGDDLVSILFTATDDLRSAFPAEAARRIGLGAVPLLCAREIPVEGSMPSVVRILMHFYTALAAADVAHVYLDGAESLRDDLDVGA